MKPSTASLGRRVAAAAATLTALAVLATPAAAVECKSKFLVGTWTASDFDPDIEDDKIDVCSLQFNTKGEVMAGACTVFPKGRKESRLDGRLTVNKACAVSGRLVFIDRKTNKKLTFPVKNGTLDPKSGVLTVKPFVFFQQW